MGKFGDSSVELSNFCKVFHREFPSKTVFSPSYFPVPLPLDVLKRYKKLVLQLNYFIALWNIFVGSCYVLYLTQADNSLQFFEPAHVFYAKFVYASQIIKQESLLDAESCGSRSSRPRTLSWRSTRRRTRRQPPEEIGAGRFLSQRTPTSQPGCPRQPRTER